MFYISKNKKKKKIAANGNRYEGEWHHDKKNGIGEFYHLATAQRQVGYWENEVCVTSKMEDIRFRQSAVFPTCYPIPQLKLKAEVPCSVFLESVHKIINERNEHCQIQEH